MGRLRILTPRARIESGCCIKAFGRRVKGRIDTMALFTYFEVTTTGKRQWI